MLNALPPSVLETFGWTLIHSLWQGTLIAALLFFVLLFVKKSQVRYVISCVALVLMLLVPVITFGILFERPTPSVATNIAPDVSLESQPLDVDTPTNLDTSQIRPLEEEQPRGVAFTQTDERSWRQRLRDYLPYVVGLWLVGVVVLSLRLLLQWLYAERFKRKHTRAASTNLQQLLRVLALRMRVSYPVRLLESSLVDAPTVIGFLKPVILLPTSALTGLTMQQLEALLAHELAHIRRHDYLVNILQSVIETLLFYHPAVWWVSHCIRVEREHCCDDVAVGMSGNAVVYAKALATLEQLRSQPRFALAANSLSLVKRIRRLVAKPTTRTRFPASWLISFSTLAALFLVTGFWLYPQLTKAQTSSALLRVFDRNGEELTEEIAPHAFGMIKKQLVEKLGRDVLEQNLNVYSTVDLQAQLSANEASLNAEMPLGAQMAVVGIDPSTGGVLAVVGEYLQAGQKAGELNRATQSYRQIAHSFKPIVYATAFEQAGFTQATVLVDEPTAFKVPGQADYKPANHDNAFMGSMTVRRALDISRNLIVLKTIEAVTPDAVVAKAKELGYTGAAPYWSLALGSVDTTPLQHAAAFGSFANGGIYNESFIINRVEDRAENILYETTPVAKRVWSEQTAYLTLDMMHGNVVDEGAFSRRAAIDGRYVAGKTGTSNDERDIWFVGMTPGIVATVWIGYDDNSSIPKKMEPELTRAGDGVINSSRQPIYIWHDFVEGALRGQPIEEYPIPEGITFRNINLTTGEAGSVRAAFLAQADESMTQPDGEGSSVSEAGLEPATQQLQKHIWVSAVGAVAFSDDYSETAYIGPEGSYPKSYVLVEEREGNNSKKIKVTQSSEGQLIYTYFVNNKEQMIDEEAMHWYREIWSLIAHVNRTGDFGEDWTVRWSQSDAVGEDENGNSWIENLYNAFGYKNNESIFISYIKDPLSGFPNLLSSVQISYENASLVRLIDEPEFSAYGYIMQAQHALNHIYFDGGRVGADLAIRPYVQDLLENVPLTTRDLEAILPLIEAVQAPETKKELLLKYLDKVSSLSNAGLEQSISFMPPFDNAEVVTNFGNTGNSVSLRAPNIEVPVKAMQDGVVLAAEFLSWNDGYVVSIEHANGFITAYSNLQSKDLPSVGQIVKQGDVIGYLGGGYMIAKEELKLYLKTADEHWVDPLQFLPKLSRGLEPNRVYQHPYLVAPEPSTAIDSLYYLDTEVGASENPRSVESLVQDHNAREIPFTFDPTQIGIPDLLEKAYTIRIVVQDEQGERELLRRRVHAAQPTEALFKIYGKATAHLFINDVLFMSWNP